MRERMEIKTHTLGVALSAGWPMALAVLILGGAMLLILPLRMALEMLAILLVFVALAFWWCLRMYLGTYLFLPATEIKGARIIARLGRNDEVEISGILADELLVKQDWFEKRCGVCHLRQKGTAVYLRGVREPEKVRAWIAENFPQERRVQSPKGKKAKK